MLSIRSLYRETTESVGAANYSRLPIMNDVGIAPNPTCRLCGSPITGRKRRKQKFCSVACYSYSVRCVTYGKSQWTPERQELLWELWPEMSAGAIAQRLGATKNAVMGRLSRQGQLKPSKKSTYRRIPGAQVSNSTYQSVMSDKDFVGCRFIEGEPSPLRRGMFCCAPVDSGSSYCDHHYKRTHTIVSHDELEKIVSAASDEREAA